MTRRRILEQQLQAAQNISQQAISGQGFDPRGGFGVLAAQLATAGIGAHARNKTEKALAAQDLQEQQQFEAANPELAGLGLSRQGRQQVALRKALEQIKQPEAPKFSIQKTETGLVRVNPATGEAFPITTEAGQRVGVKPLKKGKKPLSGEAAKLVTLSTGGLDAIDELESKLQEVGGVVPKRSQLAPGIFKTPRGRQITLLRKDLADSIGRLRSGGAINEDELKTFKSFVPNATDDEETVQFKLGKLRDKFNTLQAGLTGEEVTQQETQMSDKEAALAELRRRGRI